MDNQAPPTASRVSFHFLISNLLWFVLVVGLIIGAAIDHYRIDKAVAEMQSIVSMAQQSAATDEITLHKYRSKITELQQRIAEIQK